jgi:hypothetical protein
MEYLMKSAHIVAAMHDVIILDNETLDIDGVRLIGSTLWSHIPDEAAATVSCEVNDYRKIYTEDGLLTTDDVNLLHEKAVAFVQREIRRAIADNMIPVVISHHAPQIEGAALPAYISTVRNAAFSTDLRDLYPGVHTWIFGHTHFTCDFIDPTSGTRILSNPKGYPGERGVMFQRSLVIDVPSSKLT